MKAIARDIQVTLFFKLLFLFLLWWVCFSGPKHKISPQDLFLARGGVHSQLTKTSTR
ncbi:cytochrome oxidase putative small subunit CydP [Legionella jordanis]|uniref:cytochrome oxidase putative small subunit CydP n=1 Tax=Legionella jordanis TaxID=456 RepID=UPI0035C7BABF